MRWTPGGRSSNLEDRRGGGGGMGIPGGVGGMGIGGIAILVLFAVITKQNPLELLGAAGAGGGAVAEAPISDPSEEPQVEFVSSVLDSTQVMWHRKLGGRYRDAKLVLFRDRVQSACGSAQSASGPFYCPGDEKVYIDLGFYRELQDRFGAPGDFAQAYVLAHEVGHHVQRVLGTEEEVRAAQRRNPSAANALSVRLELQADCYAGVWANAAAEAGQVEAGDMEEGIGAAAAIGDDRIQRETQGTVHPESWTHGSSAQRVEWFRRGAASGDPAACDTFAQ